MRAVAALHHLPQLVPGGQDSLPAYTEKELCDEQIKDGTLSLESCTMWRDVGDPPGGSEREG